VHQVDTVSTFPHVCERLPTEHSGDWPLTDYEDGHCDRCKQAEWDMHESGLIIHDRRIDQCTQDRRLDQGLCHPRHDRESGFPVHQIGQNDSLR